MALSPPLGASKVFELRGEAINVGAAEIGKLGHEV
jgi:hypothetical protein